MSWTPTPRWLLNGLVVPAVDPGSCRRSLGLQLKVVAQLASSSDLWLELSFKALSLLLRYRRLQWPWAPREASYYRPHAHHDEYFVFLSQYRRCYCWCRCYYCELHLVARSLISHISSLLIIPLMISNTLQHARFCTLWLSASERQR